MIHKHIHLSREICDRLVAQARLERYSQSALIEVILRDALPRRAAHWDAGAEDHIKGSEKVV
jgi:hypothetical protein